MSQNAEVTINIKNASFGYKLRKENYTLLSDINLDVKKGETVALVGINGAGKSTLLKTVAGLLELLYGEVFLSKKDIKNITSKEKAKILSFVSTETVRVNHLKVKDFISLGRFPHTNWFGNITGNDNEIVFKALETAGMLSYAEKKN